MLETDENVNEDAPEADAAPDEAPDQVAEEVVAPEEPAEEPTADEVAEAPAEDAAAEEAPAAEEEPAAEEAPAEEPAAEDAPAEEPAEAPAAEPAAAEAPPAEEPAEPEEQLSPKELRKRSRSTHEGEARPARSVGERAQERAERRRTRARQRRAYRQKQRERRAGQPRAQVEETAPVDHAAHQGTLKVRQGVVVSDKADKSITVQIDIARQHRMYKKIVRTTSTLHAHDERNEAHVGDMVRVIESRPLSRTKRWRLVEVLERAR
jgi:small subunit ribosomal protein S17